MVTWNQFSRHTPTTDRPQAGTFLARASSPTTSVRPTTNAPAPKRRRVLGALRRLVERGFERLPEPEYRAPPGDRKRCALRPVNRILSYCGRALLRTNQPIRAQLAFERPALSGEPDALVGLGRALLAGGPIGLGVVEYYGVSERHVGDPLAALRSFDSALACNPRNGDALLGRVQSLLALQRFGSAEHCAQAATIHRAELRAQTLEAMASHDGQVEERRDEIIELLHAHLLERPSDARARDRLAKHLLSAARFTTADEVAPPSGPLRELVDWATLTAAGQHQAAYRLKQEISARSALPSRFAPVSDLVRHITCLNYSTNPANALEELQSSRPRYASLTEQRLRHKLTVDLQLASGNAEYLVDHRRTYRTPTACAEATFRAAIEGRNVLVIGPSPHHRPTELDRRWADVVVTTQSPPLAGTEHSRITYVTDGTVRTNDLFYRSTLDGDPQQLLVLRPSVLRHHAPSLLGHPAVRVMPTEDSTTLMGTHFAIQRILYDLLAYSPSSVRLAGIDFFLGDESHVAGYRADPNTSVAPRSFNYSHDVAYDFWYTKTLLEHGLVDSVPAIRGILGDSLGAYLTALRWQPVSST
jgi:tetratricopeptide (TPR) repeat protein